MGTQSIITLIMISLAMMIVVAFFIHTVERNRQERLHREANLRKKLSELSYMLSGFPEGFLSSDLIILIYKSCLDLNNQLLNNNPSNKEPRQKIDEINMKIAVFQKEQQAAIFRPLDNPQQISEIPKLLNALMSYINRLHNVKAVSQKHVLIYTKQLKGLLAQTQVDKFIIAATEAENGEKHRLAIHNYNSALEKIKSADLANQYAGLVGVYMRKLEYLKEQTEQNTYTPRKADKESSSEWDTFIKDEDSWKKKSQYD